MKLKIITGLSGSGKTTALRSYEDMGYYAMDNSPAYLVEKFIELNETQENPIEKMAVVIDFRSHNLDSNMYQSFISLKEKNFKIMAKIPPIINVNTTIKKKKFNGNISPNMLKSNMSPYPINLDANR